MIYYCENEEIDITDKKFKLLKNPYFENTLEGVTYKKGDFVYKIYYDNEEYDREEVGAVLDEKSCIKLTTIENLKHIFLPVGIIRNQSHKYAGCKAIYIKPLAPNEKRIVEKPITTFFDEVTEIQKELDILTENRALVGDFGIHNMIDNGHINIFDAGGYKVDFEKKYSNKKIQNNQFNELNLLLLEMLDKEIETTCTDLGIDSLEKVRYIRYLASSTGIKKMLEKEASSYSSIKEFTDDICKTKVKTR